MDRREDRRRGVHETVNHPLHPGGHVVGNSSTARRSGSGDPIEFERLKTLVNVWVQEPTTMPWGNRSILFRDPDGNLVNLFTPVTEEAIKRFGEPMARTRSCRR